MKSAHSTWAVVVGIDTYDNFRGLTGAANDAVEAVRWLKALGVPNAQIMFHAAPCEAAADAVANSGLQAGGCTEPEIWPSFERLMDNSGERLFVFLAGHGLYEPGGARVFLTREASQKVPSNLGIEWYAKLLRGLPFARQFLIMDGCQNLAYSAERRATFEEGVHSPVKPRPPQDILQLLCFSAAQGEVARELGGRGLFSRALFEALSLTTPAQQCVDVNDETGALQLDLMRAVQRVAGPTTEREAARRWKRPQTPSVRIAHGPTAPCVPVAELEVADPVNVRVTLKPEDAVPDVKRVFMFALENDWRRDLPVPPSQLETMAYEGRLPRNLNVTVQCAVDNSARVHPGPEEFRTDDDSEIVFDLAARGKPSRKAGVQLLDGDGRVQPLRFRGALEAPELLDIDFDVDDGELPGSLALRPIGDAWTFEVPEEDADQVRGLGFSFARQLNLATPPSLDAVFRSWSRLRPATLVSLPMTRARAYRLAGLLAIDAQVQVGAVVTTLGELIAKPAVPVDGGPTTVRLDLPWGSWTQRAQVEPDTTTVVRLPPSVGVPPLRATLLRDPSGRPASAGSVITARADLAGSTVLDSTQRPRAELSEQELDSGSAWGGRVFRSSAGCAKQSRWRRYVEARSLRFPLNETGGLAVRLGSVPRAEPQSLSTSPIWDRLVTAGHLDDLEPGEAEQLAKGKWDELLFGLAGAYACYATNKDDFLHDTLRNLRRLDPDLPDLPLLEAALEVRRGKQSARVAKELSSTGVPLFRWGVPIGLASARQYEDAGLISRLEVLESRLISSSPWTMWRA
jgi:hypothetical protein